MSDKCFLIFGGGGLVGLQVARRIARDLNPERIVVASLYAREVREAISAVAEGARAGLGAAGIHFQHGGIVPGAVGEPIPIIAHGGERIVPRGSNVESPFGDSGNSSGVTINISGGVILDSEDRVRQLADRISKILGRENELSRYGVGY